jgi:hypothetical protein
VNCIEECELLNLRSFERLLIGLEVVVLRGTSSGLKNIFKKKNLKNKIKKIFRVGFIY